MSPDGRAARSDPDGRDGPCRACRTRAWLLARLAGHLDHHRDRLDELLALDDASLIAAVGGAQRTALAAERAAWLAALPPDPAALSVASVCRCQAAYPPGLRDLPTPPAVLHIAGDPGRLDALLDGPAVAIVGSREPSPYGIGVAAELARGLAAAGVTVLSGLARGIDSAAHRAALDAGAGTVAVLAAAPERAYPPRTRSLHRRCVTQGAVVSELPADTPVRRWMFPARNRLIAALTTLTVVVEARASSGALITAHHARALGRGLGAVPGRIGSPLAAGPHDLLRGGALLVDSPETVLDALFGVDGPRPEITPVAQVALSAPERTVLEGLREGRSVAEVLRRAGLSGEPGLAVLSGLELDGLIRRGPSGSYMLGAPRPPPPQG